jgi:hypothetical protein
MKKTLLLFWALALLAGAVVYARADSPLQMEIDALMGKWQWALAHEYLDGYANCYWPDATAETYDNMGQAFLLSGIKAIRQRQQGWFDTYDYSKIDLNYPEPTRFLPSSGDIIVYLYIPKQFKLLTIYYFQRRGGEVRILRQIDLYHTM